MLCCRCGTAYMYVSREERGRWEERFQERREADVRRVVDKPPPPPFTPLNSNFWGGGAELKNTGALRIHPFPGAPDSGKSRICMEITAFLQCLKLSVNFSIFHKIRRSGKRARGGAPLAKAVIPNAF